MNEIIDNIILNNTSVNKNNIPKKIFIIPYRDRKQHRELFITYMTKILEDEQGTYKFIFIHQNDKRPFNRGAMKNIGFLYVKDTYPDNYKNITLIFHDIDLMPWKKNLFDYNTTEGVVKHYYGFTFALGGMFSIKACDFEKINGFPNYWSWGFEDNLILIRWLRSKGVVDRSQFLPIQHPDVLASFHGFNRTTSKTNENKYIKKDKYDINNSNGISAIKKLLYDVSPLDLQHDMININFFVTDMSIPKDVKDEHLKNIISRFSNNSKLYEQQNRNVQNRNVQNRNVQNNIIKKRETQFMFRF